MKKNARMISLLLTLVLVSSIFTACSGSGDISEDSGVSTTPVSESTPSDSSENKIIEVENKIETVKILMDFNIMDGIDSLTDNKYVDFIEENTGVRVQMESPGPAGYNDRLNIIMASGAEMDAFMASRDQIMKFAQDGIINDLTPYITDADKYPNIVQNMAANTWLPVKNEEGIWGFPYSRFDALYQVVFVRKQWMENLNLEIPTTIDEYYEVIKAFTLNDPDGNGKNDTFGLLTGAALWEGGSAFKASFDAERYRLVDGVVTPPVITKEYKEYLKFMNKLYKEKLMDTEFPTNIVSVFMDKLKSYKYGMTSYFWHANQLPEYAQGTVHENWLSIDLPVRNDGEQAKFAYNSLNRNYVGIPTTSKKIDALMRVYDWVCSPDEGERWLYLGVENDEYKIDGNGNFEILKKRNSLHWMFTMVSPGILNDNVKKYLTLTYPKETVERLDISTKNGQLDELAASLPYYPDLSNFNLNKIVDEYTMKAVLGNFDIDETWDDYVLKYKGAGGEAAMQYWTKWYNENN